MGKLFDDAEGIAIGNYHVERISYEDTKPFILDIHYAKRMPSITYAFGMYEQNKLVGVVCYGSPPSPSLCKGIAGEQNKSLVIELNRLVLKNNEKNQASMLIGASLKLLPKPKIIVSYADTEQDHIGVVYQATNFIYTGLSDKRKEWRIKNCNIHSKTVCEMHTLEERKSDKNRFEQVDRPRKHRYIYLLANKRDKSRLTKELNYEIQPSPKKTLLN